MAGEGQILRTARENKQWDLEDAEDVTKIRVRYLKAMEEEDYAILPGTAYVKGFLRTYAKHLDLDSEEVLKLYKSSAIQEVAPTLQGPLTPMKTRPVWLRPAVALLMSIIAIALVIGIANWTQKPNTSVSSGYSPSPVPSAPKPQEPEKETSPTPGTQTPDSSNTVQTPATSNPAQELTAKLVFTEDCWLSIKIDGEKAIEETFPAGTTKEITANSKIEFLTVGNAGGVNITLNGKTVPSLGTSGQVKRNIVFDKDNLNAL